MESLAVKGTGRGRGDINLWAIPKFSVRQRSPMDIQQLAAMFPKWKAQKEEYGQ